MSEPVLIAGTVDVDPERRDEALEAGKPHMAATRAQDGCIDYVWSADLLTPGRIYVFERWRDQQALATHLKGPHYLAMRDTIASFGLHAADAIKYRIDLSEPVYDPTGTPRADFFTDPA
ncbi:MAG: antibiotic biosynthesis monooxygenase [Deltaproteobacteria bacterium]|jgi:quinol monooxygenase YgiN|nr:antibiotic biosynthesis monooxygenase [Deltaproteobacteria bacterium]